MDLQKIINENYILSGDFSDRSFIAKLHELHQWDMKAYLRLEEAIYQKSLDIKNLELLNHAFFYPFFHIYKFITNMFIAHFDPKDGYIITGIKDDSIYDMKERIELVFDGFFKGEMPQREELD